MVIVAVDFDETGNHAATLLKVPGNPKFIISERMERKLFNFILLHELDEARNVIGTVQIPKVKAFIAEAPGIFVSAPEFESEDAFIGESRSEPPALRLGGFAFFVGFCCFDSVPRLFNELVGLRKAFKQFHFLIYLR